MVRAAGVALFALGVALATWLTNEQSQPSDVHPDPTVIGATNDPAPAVSRPVRVVEEAPRQVTQAPSKLEDESRTAPPHASLTFGLSGRCIEGVDYKVSLTPLDVDQAALHVPRSKSVEPDSTITFDQLELVPVRYVLTVQGQYLAMGTVDVGLGEQRVDCDCADLPGLEILVEDDEGAPVVGADVTVGMMNARLGVLHFKSDASGYVFAGPLPAHGDYLISADAEGLAPARVGPVGISTATAGAVTRVRLERGGVITGHVKCTTGLPVAKTSVVAQSGSTQRTTITDDEGNFMFDGLAYSPTSVRVAPAGWAATACLVTPSRPSATDPCAVTLTVRPVASVSGHVRYTDGQPAGDAVLHVISANRDEARGMGGYPVTVQSDGSFVAGPLPEGVVSIYALGFPGVEVTVPTGAGAELVLPARERRTLDVHLRDELGEAVRGEVCYTVLDGTTTIGPVTATASNDGVISIRTRTASRSVGLDLAVTGYQRTIHPAVPMDGSDVELLVMRRPPYEILVTCSDRIPIAGAQMVVRWTESDGAGGRRTGPFENVTRYVTSDGLRCQQVVPPLSDGTFVVDAFGRPGLTFTVSAPGFLPASGEVGRSAEVVVLERHAIVAFR